MEKKEYSVKTIAPASARVHALRMYLDADRDGTVDAIPADYGDWKGGNGQGAVIMVNTLQYDEDEDVAARAEIRFRWDEDTPEKEEGWQASLTIDPPDRVRLYTGLQANSPEVSLQNGRVDLLEQFNACADDNGQFSLWIEAREFPSNQQEDSWRVRLMFSFTDIAHHQTDQDAQLRISHTLRMYLDADRDGTVDEIAADYGDWKGGNGQGAVIMVNTRAPEQFAENANVDPRAEICFRWDVDTPETEEGWQAFLTIDPPDRVLLYMGQERNSREVGFGNNQIDLRALEFPNDAVHDNGQFSLWIEALEFPNNQDEESWRVRLMFSFTDIAHHQTDQDAQLRIAPWIMAADFDPTDTVYTVRDTIQCTPQEPGHLATTIREFSVGAGAQVIIRPRAGGFGGKPFLRDVMKFGWVQAPHHQDLVILCELDATSQYNRIFRTVPITGNILVPGEGAQTNQDNGGNMLVSPPNECYPFGRIIYGQQLPDRRCNAADFFERQRVQAPFALDPSWLRVGHVDEFVSFVPNPGDGAWPWKILLASPRLGYILAWAAGANANIDPAALEALINNADVLNTVSRNADEPLDALRGRLIAQFGLPVPAIGVGGIEPMGVDGPGVYQGDPGPPDGQNGKFVKWAVGGNYTVQSIHAYLGELAPEMPHAPEALANNYSNAMHILDISRTILREALGTPGQPLADDYIIEIPVTIIPEILPLTAVTDCANAVNMLVLAPNYALVPKPFGPVCAGTYLFEHYIHRRLQDIGLNHQFCNDWESFHMEEGEIHCGTNQRPQQPPDDLWWNFPIAAPQN